MRNRTVIVLGADGYLGWPQAMHLSNQGYRVIAVDNLVRRRWDLECGTSSLIPISSMERRVERWRELGKGDIEWRLVDLTDAEALAELIASTKPDAVVHFAEQRSAPFSMVDREHAVMTQLNNVAGTLNLLFALHEHAPESVRIFAIIRAMLFVLIKRYRIFDLVRRHIDGHRQFHLG